MTTVCRSCGLHDGTHKADCRLIAAEARVQLQATCDHRCEFGITRTTGDPLGPPCCGRCGKELPTVIVGMDDGRISRHLPEPNAAAGMLTSKLERETRERCLVVTDLREMWNAMWTATQHAEDLAVRNRRFEVWLAEPAQQQLVADKLAVGWLWRGGRWRTFDELVEQP